MTTPQQHLKRNLYLNCDFTSKVFFRMKKHKNIDNIIKMYNPKKYIVEEKLDYNKFSKLPEFNNRIDWEKQTSYASKSRWYSTKKVLELIENTKDLRYADFQKMDLKTWHLFPISMASVQIHLR